MWFGFGTTGVFWVRWGSIFYSWLGMSSIQHEIFIESIYNNQKLSILREYSITSCDHQTIFSCFYSPFIDLSDRPSLVFELMSSDWSKSRPMKMNSRSDPSQSIYILNILASRIFKKIFFNLGTRQKIFTTSGFLDNEDQIFRKLQN